MTDPIHLHFTLVWLCKSNVCVCVYVLCACMSIRVHAWVHVCSHGCLGMSIILWIFFICSVCPKHAMQLVLLVDGCAWVWPVYRYVGQCILCTRLLHCARWWSQPHLTTGQHNTTMAGVTFTMNTGEQFDSGITGLGQDPHTAPGGIQCQGGR